MVSFLLDTNVLSEAIRPMPDLGVMTALKRHTGEVGICAPVWHELLFGWLRMPEGRRRDAIGAYLRDVVEILPLLPYDATAARVHAELRSEREARGTPMAFVDGQIASVAVANGLTLITRNSKDFDGVPGLRIKSWWRNAA